MNRVWRSCLYVPAHVERFVSRAHERGADCIQLDLEDSVPPAEKPRARAAVAAAAAAVRRGGADVMVRVNAPLGMVGEDIAVGPNVDGLLLAKTRGPDHVALIEEHVAACEARARLPEGRTLLYPIIETPAALEHVWAIARASRRIVAMSLGGEDFATGIGAQASEDALLAARQAVLFAARAAGVMPMGLVGSLADYSDLLSFRAMAERSRRLGFEGASCINPAQVPVLNAAFAPDAQEIAWARRVMAADATARAQGLGAASVDGRMIDAPIVARAARLLARAVAIAAREARPGEARSAEERPGEARSGEVGRGEAGDA